MKLFNDLEEIAKSIGYKQDYKSREYIKVENYLYVTPTVRWFGQIYTEVGVPSRSYVYRTPDHS